LKDPTILIINGGKRYNEWETKEHIYYPLSFRKTVYAFVLFLKRFQKTNNLKIPRFLLYEIVKLVAKGY
jgi:hypothetical protein